MAALEADLDQPSGHRRRPEERHDNQGRQQQTDDVLRRRERRSQRQLRAYQLGGPFRAGQVLAEEHRREHDTDQQAGQRGPGGDHGLREQTRFSPGPGDASQNLRAEHQQNDSTDGGTRQEQSLHPPDLDANHLSDQQTHAEDQQRETNALRAQVITSQFLTYRVTLPCRDRATRGVATRACGAFRQRHITRATLVSQARVADDHGGGDPVVDSQFGKHAGQVGFDRRETQVQAGADLVVRQPLGH